MVHVHGGGSLGHAAMVAVSMIQGAAWYAAVVCEKETMSVIPGLTSDTRALRVLFGAGTVNLGRGVCDDKCKRAMPSQPADSVMSPLVRSKQRHSHVLPVLFLEGE